MLGRGSQCVAMHWSSIGRSSSNVDYIDNYIVIASVPSVGGSLREQFWREGGGKGGGGLHILLAKLPFLSISPWRKIRDTRNVLPCSSGCIRSEGTSDAS